MSLSSSVFADIPPPPPDLPSNSSLHPLTSTCFRSKMNIYIFSTLSITYILLLAVSFLVLYLGYQQWRKQCSISTTATSHSDLLTYHSIVMQLSEFLGLIVFFCGGYIHLPEMMYVGYGILSGCSLGQSCFQILTCVERYLAVVHPVIYLGLKQARGIRIRNITIGCVWLICFVSMAATYLASSELTLILYYCGVLLFLTVISFCSIAVLCTLKRPGPGEVGGKREQVHQSKQRAFNTIMAIMGVLLFKVVGNVIANVTHNSSVLNDTCLVLLTIIWFDLPSMMVLPLLLLQRAGKLTCCFKCSLEQRLDWFQSTLRCM